MNQSSDAHDGPPRGSRAAVSSARDRFAVEELSTDECWKVLRSSRVGRLGICQGGRPAVFPINYIVHQHGVVFRTAAGSKLSGSQHADVAFEIDDYDEASGQASSVMISGRAEQIVEPDDWIAANRLPLFPWHIAPKAHLVRISPTSITGRRFLAAYVGRGRSS